MVVGGDTAAVTLVGRLLDPGRRARAQVVRRLQPGLPGVEVHRGELPDRRAGDEQVERLALVDVRRARGRHVDQGPLRQLPGGAEQRRTSSGSAAMPCTEPSARLIGSRTSAVHRPRALSSRMRAALTWRNSPGEGLALEQVGHLRLDALVAAGDRGDRRRRRDRESSELRSPCSATRARSACPALGLGRRRRPRGRAAASPRAARVSAYAGCGPCSPGQLARDLERGQVDLLLRSGSTARAPRRSRTAAGARRTRPAAPSARARPGASAGWTPRTPRSGSS